MIVTFNLAGAGVGLPFRYSRHQRIDQALQTSRIPAAGKLMAERVGFEPTLPCGKHAFQACAFSHSAISPLERGATT